MSDGKVIIETGLDNSGAKDGLAKLSGLVKTGIAAIGISKIVGEISQIGKAAVAVGSDFEEGMSKVSAISGAAGQDLDDLTEKAKEMGAKTKFSATEAASAFEYMAMAGWKTTDMLGGIDGIMNLAAASGEDLALVSDIVTDAITAFGLSASDSGHFADVLAAASSNANTNVSMLGESFKYVAPIAGAMKYSVEDTSLALGLMANASVKGSMAGTSLKTSLANLASPTEKMEGVMKKYGISLTNTDGTMKSLREVIEVLRDKMGGLNEATQTAAASTLFGKEAMAGMLAIINASEADYQKLAKAVNTADGTAQNMSETMQDNLKGSITILKSSLEGLGIQIYDSVETPLRNAVESGIDSVGRLSGAFSRNGFIGVVKEAGEIVDDFTDELADGNETAAKLIRPIKDLTKEALSLGKKALPPTVKAMELTVKNLDKLVPLVAAGGAAYKTYGAASKIVATTTKAVTKAKKANAAATILLNRMEKQNALQLVATNGGLTVRQTLMAVHNGQITVATAATGLWTKAQMGLNAAMNANPAGMLITAFAALAAGIGVYAVLTKDSAESTYGLTKEQERLLEACDKTTTEMEEQRKAREESVQAIDREYDGYNHLVSELQHITDENGKVKDGYEDRAKVITGTLSDALGVEIEMIDGVIQKNKEVIDSIKEIIVQKKAEALINSMQDDMSKAYEKSKKALDKYRETSEIAAEKKKELLKAQEDVNKVEEKYANKTGPKAEGAISSANATLKKAKKAYDDAANSMNKAKNSLTKFSTEVNNYNALVDASASRDIAKIEEATNALVTSYKTYTAESLKTSKEAREEMYAQADDFVKSMELIQDNAGLVADSVYEDMAKATLDSINEFNKLPGGIARGIKDIGPKASAAMISALAQANISGKLGDEGKAAMDNLITAVENSDDATREAVLIALKPILEEADYAAVEMKIKGENSTKEYAKGQNSEKALKTVKDSSKNIVKTGDKAVEDEKPYSKGFPKGEDYTLGYAAGTNSKRSFNSLYLSSKAMVDRMIGYTKQAQQSNSPAKKSRKLGVDYGDGYALGVEDTGDKAEKASEGIVKSALHGMDVQKHLAKMRSAMSMEKAMMGASMTSRVVHEFSIENQIGKLFNSNIRINNEDIKQLAREFSACVSEDIANEMDGMGMYVGERKAFRLIREAMRT